MAFNHKHLIDITEYSEEDIKLILETAKAFSEVNERAIKKVPTLKGKTIVNMFNEPSTRTRSSFELAEKRLSADSLNFGGSSTSTVKGESLVDTVETLNAYKIDCIVVRDKHAGAPYIVTQNSPASVICAGDGKHNHPTQALLDLYTIWQTKGRLDGLKVGVVGVEQPKGTTDLLAGFIPEDRVLASDQAVATFNEELMKLLKTTTHRSYVFIPKAGGADPRERNGALAHWAKIGKDMGVDLLIVPQILDWRERAGSSAGVTTSAAVNMDFYLIDVREPGGALVSRSHFKEKQVGLSDNLMNFDTFLKRGAKWLTAQELAMEGMQKMIKEFGL